MYRQPRLEEVGKQFHVTRERIRRIEAEALRKPRHPSRSEQLRSFLIEGWRQTGPVRAFFSIAAESMRAIREKM